MHTVQESSLRYRGDVDGLRGVAVLAVVAFHAGFERIVPGGFIGVDIFFVISGFIITRVIYDKIHDGTYTVADFYSRRVRRILPALTVMLMLCIAAGSVAYFPAETRQFFFNIIGAITFVSNIQFYNTTGYFFQATQSNPLLHTWSLSVEAQFYVLFPLIIWGLRNQSPKRRLYGVALLALASFCGAIFMVEIDANAAFYLMPYRAWELLIGALVALSKTANAKQSWFDEYLGAAGLLIIFISIFSFNKTMTFPGWATLAPCVGAMAVLYSGTSTQTYVKNFLSHTPIRFTGIISYSLYLWHFPIIVFAILLYAPRGFGDKLLILFICFLAAVLSWYFVERPFRGTPSRLTSGQTLLAGGIVVSIASIAAFYTSLINSKSSIPGKSADYLAVASYNQNDVYRVGTCLLTSNFNKFSTFDRDECLKLSDTKKNILIFGDSHAAHLWPGLKKQYPQINFLQATASGCKPMLPLSGENRCTELVRYVLTDFIKTHHLDEIIISARWYIADVPKLIATTSELRAYVDRIIVAGPTTEYTQPLPRLMATSVIKGQDPAGFAALFRRSEPKEIDQEFKRQIWPDGVIYLSLYSAMCKKNCIVLSRDGLPLQYDYGHFTEAGSEEVVKLISPEILFDQRTDVAN